MKVNATERDFLMMLSDADSVYRFEQADNVRRDRHRMLRSLRDRGYISVEEENGITTVTLSGLGQQGAEHG